MSAAAVTASSLTTSLKRYLRSWGLWLLLLVAPVGARFFISRDDGQAVVIAVHDHLPVMTSAMLGVSLGIVVSTLLLPIGFLYLRANTTRRQPWQIEETTIGSRVAVALGRFFADVTVLAAVLAVLTLAGWFLAWLIIPPRMLDFADIAFALWLVAGPALMGIAAIRILFDAIPWTRGPLGETLCLVLWMTSLIVPVTTNDRTGGLTANMRDFAGFVAPLTYGAPPGPPDLTIGGTTVKPGHIPVDVIAGLTSPGYVESRLIWAGIACALAALAGLAYRPHRARKQRGPGWLTRLTAAGPPRPADALAAPAKLSWAPWLGLLAAEFRLIGPGRLFPLLAIAAALAGLAADYRHVGSPAALLLLAFGLSAQAGRSEARGLLALTRTAMLSPMTRRAAFVLAGVAWSLLMAVPALVIHPSLDTLALAAGTGAAAAVTAMALGWLSRSAFTPRLVLLIAWYAYLSS